MQTTFKRLRAVSRDNIPHLSQCALDLVRAYAGTRCSRLLAKWWDIELGPNCGFRGIPLFRRAPRSIIRIGGNCEFRSAEWSNFVGVNRPCVIATLESGSMIEIGSNCGFSGAAIGCSSKISIGDRVMCGANVTISDCDWHALDSRERAAGMAGPMSPVVIGDDVWLGMNVTVLKGVHIGSRTVVGAGSVVSRSLPPDVIAAGQPARVVRHLNPGRLGEEIRDRSREAAHTL